MKRILKMLSTKVIAAIVILSFATLVLPQPAHALLSSTDAKNEACQGIALSSSPTSCNATSQKTASNLLATVINIFSLIAGVIAVIMIIIGGIKYITSQGDSANVASAKNTIIYAIVGIVIVALAQVIVRFVLFKTKV